MRVRTGVAVPVSATPSQPGGHPMEEGGYSRPEGIIPLLPYVHCCHANFNEISDACECPDIPSAAIIDTGPFIRRYVTIFPQCSLLWAVLKASTVRRQRHGSLEQPSYLT